MQDSLAPETVASRAGRLTGRLIALAVAAAALWSVALVAGVGIAPVIGGTTVESTVVNGSPMDSTSTETTTSATLVDEVGPGAAYAMVSLPLVASLLVGILASLHPRTWPVASALVVVAILGTFNLLAMLTIGIFFVPATAALLVAGLLMLVRATTVTRPPSSVA